MHWFSIDWGRAITARFDLEDEPIVIRGGGDLLSWVEFAAPPYALQHARGW